MVNELYDLSGYYPLLNEFDHKAIFENLKYPWEVLERIGDYILRFVEQARPACEIVSPDGVEISSRTLRLQETIVNVTKLIEVKERTILAGTEILLESGVILEPGAMIKSPAIIGMNTEVRQGAYLRGNILVGKHCTLGHTTEVKNSIFMNHSEAGHFAYVGDSVIGNYVNLGAGSKLANLQFRRGSDKEQEKFPPIFLRVDKEKVNTGTAKIGCFVGDYSETGCNCVTAPASFLGAHCWVYANSTVPKGFYTPKSIIK